MTVDEVLSHFPDEVPAEFLHEADNVRPIYLFQTDKQGRTVCGNCGSNFSKYHKHLEIGECPCCHKRACVVHMTRYRKAEAQRLRETWLTYHWAPSIKDPDILTCTAILSCHWFSNTKPWESEPYRYVDARYIFIPNKGGYYIARSTRFHQNFFYAGEYYNTYYSEPAEARWVLRASCRDRISSYYLASKLKIAHPNLMQIQNAVKGHALQYVFDSMKDAMREVWRQIDIMQMLAKYPLQIEYLAKSGFKSILIYAIQSRAGLGVAFNMRGHTLKEILRGKIPKSDMKYIQEHNINIQTLQRYQKIRKHPMGAGIDMQTVKEKLCICHMMDIEKVMEHVKLKKALLYLEKNDSMYGMGKSYLFSTYADYLRDCEELEMDFTEKATLFPKDLEQLHVKLQKQIKRKRDEEAERKWIARQKKLKAKYSFKADGYAIVVPKKINDLIREGKDMHNCVGGYISRVASGKTDVVYIRKVAEINKSLGTMEICDGRIKQARGKYNQDLPKEVQDFVDKFRKEVLEKKKGRKTA